MMKRKEYLQCKAILDGAPDGATHVDGDEIYWQLDADDFKWLVEMPMRNTFEYQINIIPDVQPVRSLSDIRKLCEMYEQLQTKDSWIKEIRCAWYSQNKVVLDALLGQPPHEGE